MNKDDGKSSYLRADSKELGQQKSGDMAFVSPQIRNIK
jgi:hypothetical protein